MRKKIIRVEDNDLFTLSIFPLVYVTTMMSLGKQQNLNVPCLGSSLVHQMCHRIAVCNVHDDIIALKSENKNKKYFL